MTDIELIAVPRQVLALLVRATGAMADTYVACKEQDMDIPATVADIEGMRAAVELGRRALEGETAPWE